MPESLGQEAYRAGEKILYYNLSNYFLLKLKTFQKWVIRYDQSVFAGKLIWPSPFFLYKTL